MKLIAKFLKRNWQVILIVLITIFVWYKLLDQTLFGEGYYYFDRGQDFVTQSGKIPNIVTTDVFAKILFDILPPLFKDNMTYYLAFQLLVMIILNLTFFYTLLQLTKQKWLSLTAVIIFAVSYIGLFEMLGTGNYQRFVQRIPNLVLLLASFALLEKYLRNKKTKNLTISYILFALATFMAHFSTFLLPLFLIYPIIESVFQKSKFTSLIKNSIVVLPYLVINYFIISQDPLRPSGDPIAFLTQTKGLFEKIILQFTSLNLPPFIIDKISTVANPYKNTLMIITIPIVIIYILGFFLIRKNYPKLKVLYLTSIIIIPILLILNLYLGKVDPEFNISGFHYYFLPDYYIGKIDTITAIKGDRYYLVPMFFVSIIWSSIFLAIFKTRKKFYRVFTIGFLTLYTIYNITLIWDKFDHLKPLADEVKSYISFVKSIKDDFKPNTTIVTPGYFLWPSGMIRDFYGYPDMKFLPIEKDWEKEVDKKYKDEVVAIDYNYKTKTFSKR